MTLIFSESPVSLIQLMSDTMENTKNGSEAASDEKFDTLELRNRTVTETLSPVEGLGQDKKEKVNLFNRFLHFRLLLNYFVHAHIV